MESPSRPQFLHAANHVSHRSRRGARVCRWLGAGLGCGGKISGANGGGGGSGSSSGGSSGSSSGGSADDGGILGDDAGNPLSGTYKGYFQSFAFPDGTDTVVMTLTFAGDGTITGTVFFGNGPPLAPPTNPDVGYPPRYTGSVTPYIGGVESTSLFEGVDFTVLSGTYAAPRVQLQIRSAQVWSEWCALQTSYPWYDSDAPDGGCGGQFGSYLCVPPGLTMCDGHVGSQGCYLLGPTPVSFSACEINPVCQPGWAPIDCGKLDLCRGGLQTQVCTCTATGCSVPLDQGGDISFDMQLASGTLNGGETGMGSNGVDGLEELNVILTRQ